MYHEISRLRMLTRKRSFAGFTRRAYRLYYRPGDGSVVSSLHCMNDPQEEGHMASHIERRRFLAALGSAAAAWPLAARARQDAMPVVGFVYTDLTSSEASPFVRAFQQGLREVGFIEGQNLAVEYRWPGRHYDHLSALAAELMQRRVAVIVGNTPPAIAAKKATSIIP